MTPASAQQLCGTSSLASCGESLLLVHVVQVLEAGMIAWDPPAPALAACARAGAIIHTCTHIHTHTHTRTGVCGQSLSDVVVEVVALYFVVVQDAPAAADMS
jgi:hypothetical protein